MKNLKVLKTALFVMIAFALSTAVSRVLAVSHPVQTNAAILYVKPGASGDCLSWASTCDLQSAISRSAYGDQIWVASGTYFPTTSTDRTMSFVLKLGVAIYGGFPTAGGSWDSRDWQLNQTVLSGDIGAFGDPIDNSFHVVIGSSVNNAAVLDGFFITAGNANGTFPHDSGAGMYSYLGNPTLSNLAFNNNIALAKGGGVYGYESTFTMSNVHFSANSAAYGGGLFNSVGDSSLDTVTFTDNAASMHGGGTYIISSDPTISNAIFLGNSAGEHGGGVLNTSSNPSLMNVTLSENHAGRYGGGMANFSSNPIVSNASFSINFAEMGGAIYNQLSVPYLDETVFSNNSATSCGGAICEEYSDPFITNSTFTGNSAPHGGGIYSYLGTQTLLNVTFSENSVAGKGGGMYSYESSLIMNDVTFLSNSAGVLGGGMANYKLVNCSLNNGIFSENSAVDYGGAIYNVDSNPTFSFLSFSNNTARQGGGIYNYQSDPLISNALFLQNTALERGGGMYNYFSDLTASNLTFYDNLSHLAGGALANYPGSEMNLVGAMFLNNSADVIGGGIYNNSAVLNLTNAIIWQNSPSQIAGTEVQATYSIIQGGYPGEGNFSADPLLGPLHDNGGPTLTFALLPGSPAIDAGSPTTCPPTDQRGFFRPVDGNGDGLAICDIGAFEFASFPPNFLYLPIIQK